MLFIGSCSGNFYGIDKNTGKLRWSYNIKQDGDQTSFHDDPLIAGDSVIIGTDAGRQGHIYAFDRATGKVLWKYLVRTGDLEDFGVASDIVRNGDAIYAVAKGDDLLCLDLATGKVRWHFASSFGGHDTAWENSPAMNGDTVLLAGQDGVVYAIDTHSGKLIWKTNLGSPAFTSPVIIGDSLYVGTSSQFYRLRASDGKTMSTFLIPIKPSRNVTVSGDRLLVISSDRFYLKAPSEILSLGLDSHRVRWQAKFPAGTLYTVWPYVWNGEVLASDNGHLYAYRETDGSLAWSHAFPGQQVRGIGVTPDKLYLGTMHGMIYAFTPPK